MTLSSWRDDAKGAATPQDVENVLLDYLKNRDAARGREGADRQAGCGSSTSRLGQLVISRSVLSVATTSRVSRRLKPIARICPRRVEARHAARDFAFVSEIPHTAKLEMVPGTKLHDPRIFDRGRALQPLEQAADAELRIVGLEIQRLVTAS